MHNLILSSMTVAVAPQEIICYINGKRYAMPTGRAEATVLQYLRGVFGVIVSSATCCDYAIVHDSKTQEASLHSVVGHVSHASYYST